MKEEIKLEESKIEQMNEEIKAMTQPTQPKKTKNLS